MQNRITDSVWDILHLPLFLFLNLNYVEEAVLKQEIALREEQRLLHIAAMALRAQPTTCQVLPALLSIHLWAVSSWCSCLIPHQAMSAVIPCGQALTLPVLTWLGGGRAAALPGALVGLGGMLCSDPFYCQCSISCPAVIAPWVCLESISDLELQNRVFLQRRNSKIVI